jgi:F-type H+-transporting ATPase subunit delta
VNPALQGYLAAIEEALTASGTLARAGEEMRALARLVEGNGELTLALNDGSVPVAQRRAVLDALLNGKVLDEVRHLVHQAVTTVPAAEVVASFHVLAQYLEHAASTSPAAPDDPVEVLGLRGARNRVSGYAVAVFEGVPTSELEEIEDQLFRFARTVESNRSLRTALGDRDLPVSVRQGVVASLLAGKALASSVRLANYAIKGGRARDIVATLDVLVTDAAEARGWRVARVQTASLVNEAQQAALADALATLTGHPVDLQITEDHALIGGVVVQVGDLLVDGSTRHRLNELKDHLRASEEAYQVPGAPQGPPSAEGRNTDG